MYRYMRNQDLVKVSLRSPLQEPSDWLALVKVTLTAVKVS